MLKSPSDTTIYAPALMKSPNARNGKNVIIDKITNFVDEMWIQHEKEKSSRRSSTSGRNNVQAGSSREDGCRAERDEVKAEAEQIILNVEKFRAAVESPTDEMKLYQTINSSIIHVTLIRA